jgi:DNA-binding GntR family transcriptional regulator
MVSAARTQKQRAVQRIFEKVLTGEIPPGSRLSELAIATELKISRGPVREALNQLVGKGWLEVVPGLGAFVKIPDKQELAEMYGCREALETHAVGEASRRMTPSHARRITESLDLSRQVLERVKSEGMTDWDDRAAVQWIEADVMFHQTILQASGNRQLAHTLSDVQVMQRVWSQRPDFSRYPIVRTLEHSLREHDQIAAALQARDSRRARQWMRRHVRRIGRCITRQYSPDRAIELRPSPEMVKRIRAFEQSMARMGDTEGW